MHVLRWKRIVLYDGLTGQPLVLYDAEGVVPKPHRHQPRHGPLHSAALLMSRWTQRR